MFPVRRRVNSLEQSPQTRSSRRSHRGLLAWVPWVFLAIAIYLQLHAGLVLLSADLLSADPPGHFTTGVMLHDFLLPGHSMRPLPFAECFYVRYPKVAFGHWPPMFYIIEAVWFLVFGTKIVAARWLCACIAGGCALVLYQRCRVDWGHLRALTVTALFLALPSVRHEGWNVMSDLLLAGFAFLALCSLSDYLVSGKLTHALWLASWTSVAILTKGTGWLLLAPLAAGPLVAGRIKIYLSWSYWLTIALIGIVSAPFFIWMGMLNLGYPTGIEWYLYRLRMVLWGLSVTTWVAVLAILFILTTVLSWLLPRQPLKPTQTRMVILSVWGLTLVVFIVLFPMTPELRRYYTTAIAPAAYLLAGATATLEGWLFSRGFSRARLLTTLLCAALLANFVPIQFAVTSVFSWAMGQIPRTAGQTVLVISDSDGEGAMIAARLEQDRTRSSYLLRGSKVFSISDWSGVRSTPKYETVDALHAALDSLDLDYVVLDTSAASTSSTLMLAEILRNPAGPWKLGARKSINLHSRSGELLVYSRMPALPGSRPSLSVQLGPERALRTMSCNGWREH
jgi:hypothetical protein